MLAVTSVDSNCS